MSLKPSQTETTQAASTQAAPRPRRVLPFPFEAPLDDQIGVWPIRTVPEALEPVLFPDADVFTYAILDAGVIAGLFDFLDTSDLPYRNLYTGELAEDLRDNSPYLIKLSNDAPLLKNLFTASDANTSWWTSDYGVLVVTPVDFDAAWAHFRKFTYVKSEASGKPMYLRFWSSAAMLAFAYHEGPDPLIDALVAEHTILFRDFSSLSEATIYALERRAAS